MSNWTWSTRKIRVTSYDCNDVLPSDTVYRGVYTSCQQGPTGIELVVDQWPAMRWQFFGIAAPCSGAWNFTGQLIGSRLYVSNPVVWQNPCGYSLDISFVADDFDTMLSTRECGRDFPATRSTCRLTQTAVRVSAPIMTMSYPSALGRSPLTAAQCCSICWSDASCAAFQFIDDNKSCLILASYGSPSVVNASVGDVFGLPAFRGRCVCPGDKLSSANVEAMPSRVNESIVFYLEFCQRCRVPELSSSLPSVWCLFDNRVLVRADSNNARCHIPWLDDFDGQYEHSVEFGLSVTTSDGRVMLPTHFALKTTFVIDQQY